MADKPVLYFLTKLLAVTTSILLINTAKDDIVYYTILILSFACIFTLEVLLYRIYRNKLIVVILTLAVMFACFILGLNLFFPLITVLFVHILEVTIDKNMFYHVLSVTLLLVFLIFTPEKIPAAISVAILLMLLFCRALIDKIILLKELDEKQKKTVSELNKKLADLRGLMKTLKYTASLEERNRIAARIHDQIGHGISGSIIMLEAAMMLMKDNPEKASGSIQKAINNLREGVDEIRTALREERADRYQLGINDIKAQLEEFKVTYNKKTELNTTGDLDYITLDMWACIKDNLKECLTNLLKHSNATEFILNIDVYKKIIKIEYKDNGKSGDSFEKGIGLEAIEERTVSLKGRCFFHKGENGFSITNIFTY